jgi:hypothetical protein
VRYVYTTCTLSHTRIYLYARCLYTALCFTDDMRATEMRGDAQRSNPWCVAESETRASTAAEDELVLHCYFRCPSTLYDKTPEAERQQQRWKRRKAHEAVVARSQTPAAFSVCTA